MKQKNVHFCFFNLVTGKLLEWWLVSILLNNSVFPQFFIKFCCIKANTEKLPSDFSFSIIKLLSIANTPKKSLVSRLF